MLLLLRRSLLVGAKTSDSAPPALIPNELLEAPSADVQLGVARLVPVTLISSSTHTVVIRCGLQARLGLILSGLSGLD
jgi:hypothetical protein